MAKVVTEWVENGFKYTIIATPITPATHPATKTDSTLDRMITIFQYFGNRTPERGTGQRVYDYAKQVGAKIGHHEIDTPNYTGKVMTYERSFLDHYFNEVINNPDIHNRSNIVSAEEENFDDLPF